MYIVCSMLVWCGGGGEGSCQCLYCYLQHQQETITATNAVRGAITGLLCIFEKRLATELALYCE